MEERKLSLRMYKAMVILIGGVVLLCVFECILLLRSPQCYVHEGHFVHQRLFKIQRLRKRHGEPQVNQKSSSVTTTVADLVRDVSTENIESTIETLPTESTTAMTLESNINNIENNRENISVSKNTIIEKSNKKYDDNSNNIFQRQNERQQRLREYCKKSKQLKKSPKTYASRNMLYSDQANVVYCYVPKAACTNWKRVLQVFNGKFKDPLSVGSKQAVHKLSYPSFFELRKVQTEIEWRRNLYYSFMFVRHPFERLLSAYRNKLVDPYNTQYQRTYGSRILKLFRKGLKKNVYKSGKGVTFPEFVDYIIMIYEKVGSVGLNEHWQVMHNLCHPCSTKYNYIGKMETLLEDSELILQQVGWDKKIKFPANATDKYKTRTNAIMRRFYEYLSKEQINKLYKIYEPDFTAFGYKMDEF